MVELDDLACFQAVVLTGRLGAAAVRLGLAPSTLSARLSRLEHALGLPVFHRGGRELVPNAAAHWLFKHSLNILHAEACARRSVEAGGTDTRLMFIAIEIDFVPGPLAMAVASAMEAAAALVAGTCFAAHWLEGRPKPVRVAPAAAIVLRYAADKEAKQPTSHLVALDPLVLLRRGPDPGGAPEGPVLLPRMGGLPARWLKDCLRHHHPDWDADANPTDLPDLEDRMATLPATRAVMPASALYGRLAAPSITAAPIALGVPIVASFQPDEAAAAFMSCLRTTLGKLGPFAQARPVLTSRQMDTFDLLRRTLSVTGAARLAGVTQPAVTQHLGRLEAVIGRPLFGREAGGLSLTAAGKSFAGAAALLNAARQEVVLKRPLACARASGRLELGILPSVGSGSLLVARVAQAIEAWRHRYPGYTLRIREQPNATLQARIRQGTLDLGIITTRLPRMARFDLRSSEALALVASMGSGLLPPHAAIEFDMLTQLPLVLPSRQFGLRQLIDAAGQSRGVRLQPAIEVDSLSMCLALVQSGRLGTILPPSDVTVQAEAGELSVHAISKPKIVRTLQIIYPAHRVLTDAERELVRLLQTQLAAPGGGAA